VFDQSRPGIVATRVGLCVARRWFPALRCAHLQFSQHGLPPRFVITAIGANGDVCRSISALNHVTHYRYDRLVGLSPQVSAFAPPACPDADSELFAPVQPRIISSIGSKTLRATTGGLGLPDPTRELRIEVDLVAEIRSSIRSISFSRRTRTIFPSKYDSNERANWCRTWSSRRATRLAGYLAGISRQRCRHHRFSWWASISVSPRHSLLIRLEPGVQLPEETLANRSGSCRDSAALLVQLMRHLGLAARCRFRLSHPAGARCEGTRRTYRARRTYRSGMPGARCTCPVPLDRLDPPPGLLPAKVIFRWPARRNRPRARP